MILYISRMILYLSHREIHINKFHAEKLFLKQENKNRKLHDFTIKQVAFLKGQFLLFDGVKIESM